MLIISDTAPQVHKALKAVQEYRRKNPGAPFCLFVDEADALICKTKDGSQKFERAFDELRAQDPIMVRAALVVASIFVFFSHASCVNSNYSAQ